MDQETKAQPGSSDAVARPQVWRAARSTLVGVWVFVVVAALGISLLAWLSYVHKQQRLFIPTILLSLAVLALAYAWRFGLHPKIRATASELIIVNPIRSYRFEWDDITVILPGENGLIIGSQDQSVEAWCVQKSTRAIRRGLLTRADRIAYELLDLVEIYDPPVRDSGGGLLIRRVRPAEEALLAQLEYACLEARNAHQDPGLWSEVSTYWHSVVRNPAWRTRIMFASEVPVGFVVFGSEEILRLGVPPPQTHHGFGSALLGYASQEMFDEGCPLISAWVSSTDAPSTAFLCEAGWQPSEDVRPSNHQHFPAEARMYRANPAAPRRRRV